MNAERRKLIQSAITEIENAVDSWTTAFPSQPEDDPSKDPSPERQGEVWGEFTSALESARDTLQMALDEEQGYFDNMPEGFQNGSRGDAAQDAISNLETAISELETAIEVSFESPNDRTYAIDQALDAAGSASS